MDIKPGSNANVFCHSELIWERSVFSANREHLLFEALSHEFFKRVLAIAE